MTSAQRNTKYYVVGGPVQPARDCYVVRDADLALYARLAEGDYCHVLAPVQTGKTSVMAHAANKLAADGVRVATVDLANIGGRDMSVPEWPKAAGFSPIGKVLVSLCMKP